MNGKLLQPLLDHDQKQDKKFNSIDVSVFAVRFAVRFLLLVPLLNASQAP